MAYKINASVADVGTIDVEQGLQIFLHRLNIEL